MAISAAKHGLIVLILILILLYRSSFWCFRAICGGGFGFLLDCYSCIPRRLLLCISCRLVSFLRICRIGLCYLHLCTLMSRDSGDRSGIHTLRSLCSDGSGEVHSFYILCMSELFIKVNLKARERLLDLLLLWEGMLRADLHRYRLWRV